MFANRLLSQNFEVSSEGNIIGQAHPKLLYLYKKTVIHFNHFMGNNIGLLLLHLQVHIKDGLKAIKTIENHTRQLMFYNNIMC